MLTATLPLEVRSDNGRAGAAITIQSVETVLIFANPIAGRGRGGSVAAQLRKQLQGRGYEVRTFLSKPTSTERQATQNVRAAIVIGGDGTLRGVAQWAIDNAMQALSESGVLPYPLLIVPMGTANLMGKHLGIAWSEERLAEEVGEALEARQTVQLDVAQTRDGIFLLMLGVGFDARVVHELDRVRTGPIDLTHYLLPTVRAVTDYRFESLQVAVDGECIFESAPALVLVGNIPEYGAGLRLLPLARGDDQLLDVCIMPCASRAALLKLLLTAATGEHIYQEGVIYLKGKSIRIESTQPVPVQVDGEPAGHTPVQIDLLPGRIPFIVPKRRPVS
jgi:YegS/Rv2252/BmrU family lipid kinase